MIIDKKKLHKFVSCKQEASVIEVSEILCFNEMRHCIIVNDVNEPVGIISIQDIVFKGIVNSRDLKLLKAKDIMTKEVETIEIESSSGKLCKHIKSLKNHNLPVTEQGKVVGMIDIWTLWEDLQNYKYNKNSKKAQHFKKSKHNHPRGGFEVY